MTLEDLDAAIAAVVQRHADAEAAHADLGRQMQALNQRGVDAEKVLLGIAGELKALSALREKVAS